MRTHLGSPPWVQGSERVKSPTPPSPVGVAGWDGFEGWGAYGFGVDHHCLLERASDVDGVGLGFGVSTLVFRHS